MNTPTNTPSRPRGGLLLPDGQVITRTTAMHKFGGDPMAELLHNLWLDGMDDESTGDVECVTGHVARFGRRLMITASNGAAFIIKHPNVESARQMFDACDAVYSAWMDGE